MDDLTRVDIAADVELDQLFDLGADEAERHKPAIRRPEGLWSLDLPRHVTKYVTRLLVRTQMFAI